MKSLVLTKYDITSQQKFKSSRHLQLRGKCILSWSRTQWTGRIWQNVKTNVRWHSSLYSYSEISLVSLKATHANSQSSCYWLYFWILKPEWQSVKWAMTSILWWVLSASVWDKSCKNTPAEPNPESPKHITDVLLRLLWRVAEMKSTEIKDGRWLSPCSSLGTWISHSLWFSHYITQRNQKQQWKRWRIENSTHCGLHR